MVSEIQSGISEIYCRKSVFKASFRSSTHVRRYTSLAITPANGLLVKSAYTILTYQYLKLFYFKENFSSYILPAIPVLLVVLGIIAWLSWIRLRRLVDILQFQLFRQRALLAVS